MTFIYLHLSNKINNSHVKRLEDRWSNVQLVKSLNYQYHSSKWSLESVFVEVRVRFFSRRGGMWLLYEG